MIHTWPERHMMNIDVFTCGSEGDPKKILEYMKQVVKPSHVQMNQAQRGVRKDIENAQEKPDKPQDINARSASA